MPTAPPRARKRAAPRKKKPTVVLSTPAMTDIWQRTGLLVEVLLGVMEREISDPGERSEQWERLFGTRDSAVVTLQKLVQVLAELQLRAAMGGADTAPNALVEPVNEEELALLRDWMQAQEVPNAPSA